MEPPDEAWTTLRTPAWRGRLGDADRADDVGLSVEHWVGDGSSDVDLGGEVEYDLGLVFSEDFVEVGGDDVVFDRGEVCAGGRLLEVSGAAGTAVVEADDDVSVGEESINQRRPDER